MDALEAKIVKAELNAIRFAHSSGLSGDYIQVPFPLRNDGPKEVDPHTRVVLARQS